PLEAANGVRHEEMQRAAVRRANRHVGGGFTDGAVDLRMDALTKRHDVGPSHYVIRELGFAGLPKYNARCAGVIDAELAFEPCARRRLAAELEHDRMDTEPDVVDVGRGEPVRVTELHAAVDG